MSKSTSQNNHKPIRKPPDILPKKRHTIVLTVDEDVLSWLQGEMVATSICDGIPNSGQQFAMLVLKAIRNGDKSVHIRTNFKRKKK